MKKIWTARSRLWLLGLVVLLVGLGVGVWSSLRSSGEGSKNGLSRAKAEDFSLPDSVSKAEKSLQDFKGKPVVLHFWASWCAPCIPELSEWLIAADKLKNSSIQFVAISLDRDWESALAAWPTDRVPSNTTLLLDSEQKVSERYGSYQFPETYLISSNGELVKKLVGPQEWSREDWVEGLRKVMESNEDSNTEESKR